MKGEHLGRQGPGISSEIETYCMVPPAITTWRRQGPGISSEIETNIEAMDLWNQVGSPGAWHLI